MAAVAGCGGDDERAETTPGLPELTVPTTEAAPAETTPADPPANPVDPATETLPEEGPPPAETTPEDSEENDAPPPEDTPAERFEEYCNENPGACG